MSKSDKLKERLTFFVKEGNSETSITIPNRVIQGSKLDIVSVILQDLFRDKYHKNLIVTNYEGKDNDYIFNFKE